jgi:hypothetical protein
MAITIKNNSGTFDTQYDYKRQFNRPFDALTVFTNKTISQLQSIENYLYNGEFLANNEPSKSTKPYFVTIDSKGVVTITEISLVGHTHNYASVDHTHAPSGASSSQLSDLENRVAKLESLIGFNVTVTVTATATVTPTATPPKK